MDKTNPSRYSFLNAMKLSTKCVYVFLDNDTPVYVGKTKNTKNRLQPYAAKQCHNVKLNRWLEFKGFEFDVLIYRTDDISSLEVKLIGIHKATLFNLSNGKENDWYSQNSEQAPWVAGRGILSPISQALRRMSNGSQKAVIKKWLSSLTDQERCVAEVHTCMLQPFANKRWLDLTSAKMIKCMESSL